MSRLPPIAAGGRRRLIGLVAAGALGQAAAAGSAAVATREVFSTLASGGDLPLAALCVLAASGIAIMALRIWSDVTAERLGQDYAAALRLRLFEHVSRLPLGVVRAQRQGGLALRFVGDLSAVRGWISRGITRMISAAILLPGVAAVMFGLDWRIGLAVSLPVAVGLVVLGVPGRQVGPLHERLRSRRARLSADMTERISHAPELRLMGRMDRERDRLARRTEGLVEVALAKARATGVLRAIPDAVAGIAAAAVLLVAHLDDIPLAVAAGGLAGAGLMMRPLRDLGGVWDRYRGWCAAREKAERLLARPTLAVRPASDANGKPERRPSLTFRNVGHRVLRDFSAEVAWGAKVAILGPSASGKSTLMSLAAGLEAPAAGEIDLGGVPVTGLDPRTGAGRVAFISAHTPILAGSLRRALTMGLRPRPTDDEITGVAERWGLAPVVERLGGLDGRVAEGGRNLSCGEAWRMLLVRAVLSRASLVLIDGPERLLDEAGRETLLECIRAMPATVLVTTDDPDFAAEFDRTICLDARDQMLGEAEKIRRLVPIPSPSPRVG